MHLKITSYKSNFMEKIDGDLNCFIGYIESAKQNLWLFKGEE